MRKTYMMSKTCNPERKRPEYKPKPKKQDYDMPIFQVQMFEEIPYVIIGDLPYAVDDKQLITYELTRVLREKMKKAEQNLNQTENPVI